MSALEILKIADDYDVTIIDTGGGTPQVNVQHCRFLIFSSSRSHPEVLTSGPWTRSVLVEEMSSVNPELKAFAFINHADFQGSENEEAAEMLRDSKALTFLDAPLGRRKAYSHAATAGLSVIELQRPQRNQQAINEIMTLFQRCSGVSTTSERRAR